MSSSNLTFNCFLLVPCVVTAFILMRSRIVKNELWRATLTPPLVHHRKRIPHHGSVARERRRSLFAGRVRARSRLGLEISR